MIDLQNPKSGEWRGRGFGRRFVWVYVCKLCGQETHIRCSSWTGKLPTRGIGAIMCSCETKEKGD